LFSLFVPIRENELARRARLPLETIVSALNYLNSQQVIIYQPQTENPHITFLQNRVDANHLFLSRQVYDDRKQIAKKRLDAMLRYIINEVKCRNKLLLEYFGEHWELRCGKCDVCLQRNREELSDEEFDFLQKEIQRLSQDGEQNIDYLIDKLHYPRQKIIKVIRWLLDNN
jgi:ATP-dependent DNA helicase RecQ